MKIGYARVSTVGQDLESQKEKLIQEGCERLFVEKVTGTSTAPRTQLQEMKEFAREGDTIIVTKIDRLARSIIDLNNIVREMNRKGVTVRFLHDNLEFRAGKQATAMQELMFNILGSFAQFERSLIVERTAEGRERAKKQGKHLGRPAKPKKDVNRALELYDGRETNGMSVNDIAKLTSVPRSTIYNELKKRGDKHE